MTSLSSYCSWRVSSIGDRLTSPPALVGYDPPSRGEKTGKDHRHIESECPESRDVDGQDQ